MASAASESSASLTGPNTWVKLAGIPVWAMAPMECRVAVLSAMAAGAAMAAARIAGTAIQQMTIVTILCGTHAERLEDAQIVHPVPGGHQDRVGTPRLAVIATISASRPIRALAIA